MALSLLQTNALRNILKPGMLLASFGYPDLIAPEELIFDGFYIGESSIEYRKDSEAICRRHGLKQRQIPDAHSFFKALACGLDVFDIVNERGCEIFCDLNYPIGIREPYDIVLDVGTVEHCFNIGLALMNMAIMVKEGGYIIHENPANWGNHGFYNLNPTLFADFYEQNGFEVQELKLVTRDGRTGIPNPVKRFKYPDEEVNIFCIAQRKSVRSFVYPVQTKYKSLIPAAEERANVPPTNRAIGEAHG